MEDTELHIAPEVFDEILRNTDKKNNIAKPERLLRKSMVQLVKSGHASFLFLYDDESRDYWSKLVKQAAATVEKNREAWRIYEVKQRAYDRLSEADRKILKLREPSKPRSPNPDA